jgi:hypothetical protein
MNAPHDLRGEQRMSESTETESKKERDGEDAEESRESEDNGKGEKKGRPWKRWVIGALALVVVIVVAVVVLGGSSKKKATPGGTLTANGKEQLLPVSASGKLAGSPGQKVTGSKLVVRSIVKGKGFFVGGSNVNRVYVLYAGPSSQVGGTVGLKGVVRPAPADVARTLKLSKEDAAKVTAEGGYISASTVTAGP